jgi:glutamate dehydrogenase
MDSDSMGADAAARQRLLSSLGHALRADALPGELEDFNEAQALEAADFILACADRRQEGEALVRLESQGGQVGQRRIRIAVINDDMPFLVDSVAAAVTGYGIVIHRLLHPVVQAIRDEGGLLTRIEEKDEAPAGALRESIIYMEVDRAEARKRRDLAADLHRALADVRAAVADWPAMQQRMEGDAALVDDPEGRALLEWFASGAMTLLGYQVERPGLASSNGLGIYRIPTPPDEEGGCDSAIRYFRDGGQVPLVAKAERRSSVHRRVPLDLIAVPIRENGEVTAIGVHAGLWTSQALGAAVDNVPLLRRHMKELEASLGFDASGHSGKALRHAISTLPHDLLVNLTTDCIRELVLTAMSLADRPRSTLLLVRSTLKGHLFAFVWLPRDELTTRRRVQIGDMIASAAKGKLSSWSVALGDGDLALVRYTMVVDPRTPTPDSEILDRRLDAMVRGWEPNVEEAIGHLVGPARAVRLAMNYAPDFPQAYRARYPIEDAALDIVRVDGLQDATKRSVRLYDLDGDPEDRLRLKIYRVGELMMLSDVVPVLENFGFKVLKETPTRLIRDPEIHIHEFALRTADGSPRGPLLARAEVIEEVVASVLEGRSENDVFNQLIVSVGLKPRDVVLLRAWFRYLRQTGLSYSMITVAEALRRSPDVTRFLIGLFDAMHEPGLAAREEGIAAAERHIDEHLAEVAAIDEDRILRLLRGVVRATLRTNAFAPSRVEALAFKMDSGLVPGLPAPVPWREIWVYSPRVEGIHLRGGPVARGGLRWSDRRDDFRTEILGLMKAQLVKNAVIVPTGAKGGFYPKQLPPQGPLASNRDAWLAEGTESYRIFIRALLSVTDNLVQGEVVHPEGVTIRDGDDPYFVVAADKGTATFSDIANKIALDRGFWLGDAFASGGSNGYDHKAMGITARGAWVSVQRHFREAGVDVQTQPIRVAGVGDMSGDVFGNGMLLSKALKVVAAFDHRHIFLDPDPDPATSWEERKRMFDLPRSSWADYHTELLSKGGGIFPRSQKAIPLSAEVQAMLGVEDAELDPASLIRAILKSNVDLLWFGGIGTYIKASHQSQSEAGDPGNDAVRVNAGELRAKAIGEGANLAITQAARVEFAATGGRVNTDFIDNSAGVDCSDNEVNIKIPLNREMVEARLSLEDRNAFLAEMTEDVAAIVLEDNRLQTLALSIAERGGAAALPPLVRTIELLEESGRLNRQVEGLESNEELLRRANENRGLTRPELAVLLSTAKMQLQGAIEKANLADDPTMVAELVGAFPRPMQERFRTAIEQHRLRKEIIATKVANRMVNRLGIVAPFSLVEEEGASFGQTANAFVAAERLFDVGALWAALDAAAMPEQVRLELFEQTARAVQLHVADILRCTAPSLLPGDIVALLQPGLSKLDAVLQDLLRPEPRADAGALRNRLVTMGGPAALVDRIVRLHELNGAVGLAMLGQRSGADEIALTKAYTQLGEALGLDWAQNAANHFEPRDQWERLLTAGLARDFEELRLAFLDKRGGGDPRAQVDAWVKDQAPRIDQFRRTVERARIAPVTTAPMLAQIATQARVLLGR